MRGHCGGGRGTTTCEGGPGALRLRGKLPARAICQEIGSQASGAWPVCEVDATPVAGDGWGGCRRTWPPAVSCRSPFTRPLRSPPPMGAPRLPWELPACWLSGGRSPGWGTGKARVGWARPGVGCWGGGAPTLGPPGPPACAPPQPSPHGGWPGPGIPGSLPAQASGDIGGWPQGPAPAVPEGSAGGRAGAADSPQSCGLQSQGTTWWLLLE